MKPLAPALAAVLAAVLGLSACATTPEVINAPYASAQDCAVIAAALELFPIPEDGSAMKVYAIAVPETPPFRPQRPEQRSPGPLNLRACNFGRVVEWVTANPSFTLGRPEIHDDMVIVPYSDRSGARPVYAVLEPTENGGWRHRGALVSGR